MKMLVVALIMIVVLPTAVWTQEALDNGPYMQVYPPVNTPLDEPCTPEKNGTCPLFVALLMSFGGAARSSGVIPGIQIALDQINNDSTILPGYTLHYTLMDTQCDRKTALEAFFTEILQPPTKISLIGAGCSPATEPTAEVSQFYNITQVSCVSPSLELADHSRFRTHFQSCTNVIYWAYGFYGIISKFKWRRVAIITQEENVFTVSMDKLKYLLLSTDVEYTEKRFSSREGIKQLGDEIFDPESRIFILSMYSNHAREVICKAYQNNLRYPRYLFLETFANSWWLGNKTEQESLVSKYGCTVTQRESMIHSMLAIAAGRNIPNHTAVADSGINGHQIDELYARYLNDSALKIKPDPLNRYRLCYDATWTLARALNNTLSEIIDNEETRNNVSQYCNLNETETFGLHHFTYNNSGLLDIIFRHMVETDYNGIMGRITYNKQDGARHVGSIHIYQYRYPNETGPGDILDLASKVLVVEIAYILREPDDEFYYEFSYREGQEKLMWIDGVPYDGVPDEVIATVSTPVTAVYSLLSAIGIVFAVSCITFNFAFRKRKLIRLTSPNLNYLIGGGAIILYVDVYFYVIPTANPTVVTAFWNITPWLTAIGYSLCYGTLLAKMFRVYYIFNNPTPKKKTLLSDWFLALGVLLLVMIDVVILFIFMASEGPKGNLSAKRVSSRENPIDIEGKLGMIHEYYIYICDSKSRDIALGILFGYKAALQIIALLFAFSTRKVKVKGLDDALYIAAAIYVTSIVTAVIIVAVYTLKEYINGLAAVFSSGLIIGTTVILILVFVPKMVDFYKDPHGETVFSRSSAPNSIDKNHAISGNNTTDSYTVELLKKKVVELESQLAINENATTDTKDTTLELGSDTKMPEGKQVSSGFLSVTFDK